jgi:murein DD-endopeptidase MepM/ murein hydrolase activator NlpD
VQLRRAKGHTVLAAGEAAALVYVHQLFPTGETPDRLVIEARSDLGRTRITVPIERASEASAYRLPVTGRWQVLTGHGRDDHHASLLFPAQTFAYDLLRVGDGGRTHAGSATDSRSYLAHDGAVQAAADGIVVDLSDGMADNHPVGSMPSQRQVERDPRRLAGNSVVIKHAGQEFSAYFHLRSGIRLRVGQRVAAGELLGRCGNTGMSLEPHLHFQLQDGPNILTANPIPARFGDFTFYYGHQAIYVPSTSPMPLPTRLPLEPGRAKDAIVIDRILERGPHSHP